MPPESKQPSRRFRPLIFFTALAVICVATYKLTRPQAQRSETPKTVAQAAHPAPPVLSAPRSNPLPQPAIPGTKISAEEVLDKLDKWLAENPNYHAIVETTFPNGNMLGKLDVFTYTNGAAGTVVRMKGEILAPQSVQFQAQKQNGKLQVYFPKTNRLIEPSSTNLLGSIPGLGPNPVGMKPLLKLARSTFAEASADLEVATLVISSESLKLPETSGDIYLSVRINSQGRLLGIEEAAQGQRIISKIKYLSFDRALVARTAPTLPVGKVVVSDKTLQDAMKDEARTVINKPLGTKI